MSENLAESLDLDLAWLRVGDDASHREFVRRVFERELIEVDLGSWLISLQQEILAGYAPSAPSIADVPKGNGAVRPGALLPINDRIVYAACVGAALPTIHSALKWAQGTVDFSHQLASAPSKSAWVKNRFQGWDAFRETSLKKIDDGASWVVITDITAFYDNIEIGTLISDLRHLGVEKDNVNLLSTCLNRWALMNGRGIPQALTPSDILAKVYMNNIDLGLQQEGIDHLRYVDDIRIFCDSEIDARKALLQLIRLLRQRGLNLQSAKTEILAADQARQIIQGIAEELDPVKDKFVKKVIEDTGYFGGYLSIIEADKLLDGSPLDSTEETLADEFRKAFLQEKPTTNKTLLHFLLNRLGKLKNRIAVDYCLELLKEYPEETGYALQYFHRVEADDTILSGVNTFLDSEYAIYDYQIYLIFRWLDELELTNSAAFLSKARQYSYDHSRPNYLRAITKLYIAKNGTAADLERFQAGYGALSDPLEKAQSLCFLVRMESGRRNSFLQRARADHELCTRAFKFVKNAGG